MTTYRTGNHWGVTIVCEGGTSFFSGSPVDAQLVAVVVNGDQALAERICALLNGDQGAAEDAAALAAARQALDRWLGKTGEAYETRQFTADLRKALGR